MNTRQPIQPSSTPAVLAISYSTSQRRFTVGLSNGIKVLRSDNCLTTFEPDLFFYHGAAVTAMHNDRFVAFVPSRRADNGTNPNHFHFWDMILNKEITKFNLFEPIQGLRMDAKFMVTILAERAVVFQYQSLDPRSLNKTRDAGDQIDSDCKVTAPNKPHSLHRTSLNPFALGCLHDNLLVLPAQSPGQVQLITLKSGTESSTKRVLRAHKSALRCMALSTDGTLLATASEQGTLIRIFRTSSSQEQIFEFRRGVDAAIIYSIAFSPQNRWLACTSDKGTLHVFDLEPNSRLTDLPASPSSFSKDRNQQRRSSSHITNRPSSGSSPASFIPPPSISNFSSRSVTPSTAIAGTALGMTTGTGSIQEYYHLVPKPPTPSSTSSPPHSSRGVLGGSALKPSPFTPRIFTDARSTVSASFYIGDDPPHWQSVGPGGASLYTWTVAPGGGKKRVRRPVRPLPCDPSGRPPKGVLAFDGESTLYVVGGGSDARWEKFELKPCPATETAVEWRLEYIGFRRYLSKQYVK